MDPVTIRSNRRMLLVVVIAALLAAGAATSIAAVRTGVGMTPERCSLLGSFGRGNDVQRHCYAVVAHRLVAHDGPSAVVGLELASATDPALHGACHNLMHGEGRRIGHALRGQAQVKATMELVPSTQTGTCGAGMTHGIFEGYVERNGLTSGDTAAFTIMCGKLTARMRRYDCTHGLGHAATRRNGLDVEPSVTFCRAMPEPDSSDCVSAVLMTHAEGPLLQGGPMSELRSAHELWAYCEHQTGEARVACARWIPLTSTFNHALSRPTIVQACTRAPAGSPERVACFSGVGRQAPGEDHRACDGLPDAAASAACSYGLLVGWVINRVDVQPATAGALCSWRRTSADRNACYLAVGRVRASLHAPSTGASAGALCEAAVADEAPGRADALRWCERGTKLTWQPLDYSPAEVRALRDVLGAA